MTRIARRMTLTLTALLLLLGTFGVAAAAEHSPPPPTTHYAELEQQYHLRQQQLYSLNELLTRDEHRIAEITSMIAHAKAESKNTAALEQALATYRSKLGAARTALYRAAAALKTHAGFSTAGKVTNADQARATLKTAGSALEQSYLTVRSAEELLNKAVACSTAKSSVPFIEANTLGAHRAHPVFVVSSRTPQRIPWRVAWGHRLWHHLGSAASARSPT